MANTSDYEVVTFQRVPGQWRANITRRTRGGAKPGPALLGFVTKEDSDSEAGAQNAANEAIKNLIS
jgi:hypothetical protein